MRYAGIGKIFAHNQHHQLWNEPKLSHSLTTASGNVWMYYLTTAQSSQPVQYRPVWALNGNSFKMATNFKFVVYVPSNSQNITWL